MRYRYYIEKNAADILTVVGKNSKERTYNVYACKSAMYCLRCPISWWMPGNPGEARGEFVVWHSSCSKSSSNYKAGAHWLWHKPDPDRGIDPVH